MTQVGIIGYGLYLPSARQEWDEIAAAAGLSLNELNALGLKARLLPSMDDQPVPMAVTAAKRALKRASLEPMDVDLVIWTGEEYKDYIAQTASIRLQEEVGCKNAWAYDLVGQGITLVLGLRVARDMIIGDNSINTVLLAGGTRNCDLVDPTNPDTRFMLPCSASGAAMVVQRNPDANLLLDVSMSTDPHMADEIYVPGGGTEIPFSPDNLDSDIMYFKVQHPEKVQSYLSDVFPTRLAREVANLVGNKKLDYLALRHLPVNARKAVLDELKLADSASLPLDLWGHHGSGDVVISLHQALGMGVMREGSLVALASAGIGFTYAAALIKWGHV